MFAEGIEAALSLSLPLPAKILNSFAGILVFYGKSFELCKKNCCVEVSMWIFFFPWVFHAWIGLKVVFLCGFYFKGGVFLELGVWLLRKHGKMIEKLVNVHATQLPNFYTISKLNFFFVRYFDESNGSSFVFVNLIFTLNFVTFCLFLG